MNRPLRFSDLFFSHGRERWSNNLFVKLGLGCLSVLCLGCVCSGCLALWLLTPSWKPAEATATPFFFEPVYTPLVFTPDSLPPAQEGEVYSAEIVVSQNVTPVGGFYISEGELPVGMMLEQVADEDVAILSGIPEQAGTYSFTVSAWCKGTYVDGQSGPKKYELGVEE
jgi:hypothetical protein